MYPVAVRIRPGGPGEPTAEDAASLRAAVGVSAHRRDRLEHVYAQIDDAELTLVLWLIAADLDAAEATARAVVDRALESCSSDYAVESCQVELTQVVAEAMLHFESDDPWRDPGEL